ncbi:TonB-dependent receptor [Komagataeibacter oboediens]|uniref:TonB-dependent receptor n=1 Tax=Komagataeibacter oboediens TaxID=65958 RepID=UPI0002D93CD8|nr:TonB-dependent receptor [Komagataeibacter oboediens]
MSLLPLSVDRYRMHFRYLLVGTSLSGMLTPIAAFAAMTGDTTEKTVVQKPGNNASTSAPGPELIKVTRKIGVDGVTRTAAGGGLITEESAPKSVSTVGRDYIAKQPPSATVFQLMKMSPGVNFSANDPYGVNGGDVTVRGLDSNQIGFTLEGAPLNDIASYAIFPQEYVDSENLRQIRIAQGTADLGAPHIGASGGTVNMSMLDPAAKAGGQFNFTYGSFAADREFLRLDSGDIAKSGVRAFISYSHFHDDHFRGPGTDNRNHVDFKIMKNFDNGSRMALSVSYNQTFNAFYSNPTLSQWQTSGLHSNYDQNYTQNDTSYYQYHTNPYTNVVAAAPMHFVINKSASVNFTPYFWYGYGAGGGATVLNESGYYSGDVKYSSDLNGNGTTNDKVLLYSPTISHTYRPGYITSLNYNVAHNKITAGYWFEYSNEAQFTPFSYVDGNGSPASTMGQQNNVYTPNGSVLYNRNQITYTTVNALFLGDSISLFHDRFNFDIGVKETMVRRDGTNLIPSTTYKTIINDAQVTPQLAARYKIDRHNQVFLTASTNFRSPPNATLFANYSSTTGSLVTASNAKQKDEYSIEEELGYRYQGNIGDFSVALFNYNFVNRQVTSQVLIDGAYDTESINAGGQTSRGIDIEAGLRPWHHFRPYIAGEYLHATIDNNFLSNGVYLPTAGKIAVRSPKFQFSFALDYDDGHFFGNAGIKWVDSQYSTFMNDQSIPAYVTSDITLGYRFSNFGPLHSPQLRLNFMNVGNNHYLSGIAGVQANAKTVYSGTKSVAGVNPTYYVGSPFAAIFTFGTGF